MLSDDSCTRIQLKIIPIGKNLKIKKYPAVQMILIVLSVCFGPLTMAAEMGEGVGREGYLRAQRLKEFFTSDMNDEKDQTDLPSMIVRDDFNEFRVGGVSANKFYADVSSVSVAENGTVWLALGVLAPSGVWTLTFEGFSCKTNQYKIYGSAFGFEGAWRKNTRARWVSTSNGKNSNFRNDLARYYLCLRSPLSRDSIANALADGNLKVPSDSPGRYY